jgi:hypothetical protein
MALIRVGFDSDKGASLPQWSGSGPVSHHNTPTDRFDRREEVSWNRFQFIVY